jgi:hypothetical protein
MQGNLRTGWTMSVEHHATEAVEIDEGMRRWYASCRCCFGDAYPELKKTLDAERGAAKQNGAGPGICEEAEAQPQST